MESFHRSELLDKWYASKPWQAKTKNMDFREGGLWLYYMEGPDGTQSWCRVDFKKSIPKIHLLPKIHFVMMAGGKDNPDFPHMQWKNEFYETKTGSKVEIEISFPSEADLEKIGEMGFKEGFTSALGNLDELLMK